MKKLWNYLRGTISRGASYNHLSLKIILRSEWWGEPLLEITTLSIDWWRHHPPLASPTCLLFFCRSGLSFAPFLEKNNAPINHFLNSTCAFVLWPASDSHQILDQSGPHLMQTQVRAVFRLDSFLSQLFMGKEETISSTQINVVVGCWSVRLTLIFLTQINVEK
jgi:hypothetical protein